MVSKIFFLFPTDFLLIRVQKDTKPFPVSDEVRDGCFGGLHFSVKVIPRLYILTTVLRPEQRDCATGDR